MKQQQGVSYSINYVFTCGKRRVRICRNIYDQTNNNTDNLVEVGSNGLIGGFRQDQSGKQCLHQQQMGLGEGQKKDSNGFGGNGIKGCQWVISSQKQLLLVGSPTQKDGEESKGLLEERKRGGCMKCFNQGQNLKKCQCFEYVSFMNQSKCNLSSSTSSSLQEGKEETSYHISSIQNSVENLRLITDFYLHKVSEIHGVLETHLLLRVEDTFIDLDESNTSLSSSTTTAAQANKSAKNYVYNRRILNGFLYKKSGFYVQFTPSTSDENLKTENKTDSYSSYYPNSTDINLKNENFTFKFNISQTEQGFSVQGNLESRSPLVQIQQQQQAYHVSVLQQEQQTKNENTQTEAQKESTTKIIVSTQQNEAASQYESQKSTVDESADEDDDTLSSSLTIQINNNNRHDFNSENELLSAKKAKNIQNSSAKKSSMKKTPKLSSLNLSEQEKRVSKKSKRLQNSYENEHFEDEDEVQEKKFLSTTKKSSVKSHKSQVSTSCDEQEDIKKSSTPQKLSKRHYISDEVDEEEDEDHYEQNSWESHSKGSTQQHSLSQIKGYHNQLHNEDYNSSQNPNAPVQPKKNVVKNFVKAFRNFVNNWGDETRIMQALGVTTREELQNFRLEYKKFESMHKFNNTFIKALILNQPFKPVFNYFVNEEAWEWLDKSQVNNKKAHKDVLRDYIKATQDPSRIDEIHSLRTRNRQSSKKIKSQ